MAARRDFPGDEGEYRLGVRFPIAMGIKLREMAEQNRRSLNNEVIHLIERGLAAEKSASAPSA